MIRLSSGAARDVDALLAYYEERERPEATAGLLAALERAAARIERTPEIGLPAPRPYPILARTGRLWVKEGAYWIAYAITAPETVIVGVFHERADIPGRAWL